MRLGILIKQLEAVNISISILTSNQDYYGATLLVDYKDKIEKEIEDCYEKEIQDSIIDCLNDKHLATLCQICSSFILLDTKDNFMISKYGIKEILKQYEQYRKELLTS